MTGRECKVIEEADLRALVRLLGETAIQQGGLMMKRCYLLDGLCDFAGACEWEWILGRPGGPASLMRRRLDQPYSPTLPPAEEEIAKVKPRKEGPRRIVTHHQTGREESLIALNRSEKERAYSVRERSVTRLVLNQLPWLHWREIAVQTEPKKLSPRLRLVMDLLLIGLPRKEIAAQIGISHGTANAYIRDLYRHFQVNSHAELIRTQNLRTTRKST